MRVEVSASHLARGIPRNPCLCPLALAWSDATGRSAWVQPRPGIGDVWTVEFPDGETVILSEEMQQYARQIDAGEKVPPRVFETAYEPRRAAEIHDEVWPDFIV